MRSSKKPLHQMLDTAWKAICKGIGMGFENLFMTSAKDSSRKHLKGAPRAGFILALDITQYE